jgi:hypothetical protein
MPLVSSKPMSSSISRHAMPRKPIGRKPRLAPAVRSACRFSTNSPTSRTARCRCPGPTRIRRPILIDRNLAHGVEAMPGRERMDDVAAQVSGEPGRKSGIGDPRGMAASGIVFSTSGKPGVEAGPGAELRLNAGSTGSTQIGHRTDRLRVSGGATRHHQQNPMRRYWWIALPANPPTRSISERLCIEHRSPVSAALFQKRIPDVPRILLIQSFENFKLEMLRPVSSPGRL